MTINRHNYEEFFILYLDNELSSGDRRQVEIFAQQHPDLGEELQMLQQTRLDIDPSIVFEGKEILMKSSSQDLINETNYEEFLVQYIDNELNDEQDAAVETYAINNPSVKAELDLLLRTKLKPEASIIFFDKETLYRKEETPVRRIVPVMWWRIAAAVLLLIALTIGGFTFFKNNRTPGRDLAGTKEPGNTIVPVITNNKKEPVEEKPAFTKTNPDQPLKEENIEQKVEQTNFARKNTSRPEIIKKSVENDVPQIAYVNPQEDNNLPESIYNPNMKEGIRNTPELVAKKSGLTESLENNSHPLVTSASLASLKNTDTREGEIEPEKTTKFRGLLRKITRTFEKTTNIKATDDDDRLLVAGLAIRL